MEPTITTYIVYLAIALPLTIWVARTLHRNGRIFLIDCFRQNEELADSVNHLLVVGFYLVNFGFVVLYLKITEAVVDTRGIFEALSGKIGTVLLILGIMHFLNIFLFTKMRRRAEREKTPPLPPAGQLPPRPVPHPANVPPRPPQG